jgi:hypothetical protein
MSVRDHFIFYFFSRERIGRDIQSIQRELERDRDFGSKKKADLNNMILQTAGSRLVQGVAIAPVLIIFLPIKFTRLEYPL